MHIQWTKGAKQNLKQIEEYIAQDSPNSAIDTVLKIINSAERLADHPAMGRVGRIFNTRELVISNTPYIVAYRVKEGHIQILRVLHAAMRWPNFI